MWGAAETLRETSGAPIPPVERPAYESSVTAARAQLGEKPFATAWAEGRLMTPEQALAARELGMSVSVFHHHFKAVTALSPLQFQKRLRLLEARRLLLGEDLDAASAAYRVGYHDASHFNREYKSLFGVPPMRDVQRLREAAMQGAGR